MTSRPYKLGWMKHLLWDPWQAANRNHADIDIINFRSIDNPAFPKEEYYRCKKTMPPWRFSMLYDGLFSRPAGLIYGSFDETRHKIPRIAIPDHRPRFLGTSAAPTPPASSSPSSAMLTTSRRAGCSPIASTGPGTARRPSTATI